MPVKQSLLRLAVIGWRGKACCTWPMIRPGSTKFAAPGAASLVAPGLVKEDSWRILIARKKKWRILF